MKTPSASSGKSALADLIIVCLTEEASFLARTEGLCLKGNVDQPLKQRAKQSGQHAPPACVVISGALIAEQPGAHNAQHCHAYGYDNQDNNLF